MLGLIGNNQPWRWKAVGKHPTAADYINVQKGTPLMEAMADWVAKGYEELQRNRPLSSIYYSWRFWLRGAQKDSLICGVGRDSSDRIGRPFPLLIIGEGNLKGWEKKWTTLPARLAKTWGRMERIAAHRYEDLESLVYDLGHLASPRADDGQDDRNVEAFDETIGRDRLRLCRANLEQSGRAMIALNDSRNLDLDSAAIGWHGQLMTCCPDIPRAVFFGGTANHVYMAVIRQPLNTADFVRLWSA